MNRRTFLAALSAGAMAAQTRRKPNIIWFMADDLGWGDVGCYGQKHINTPNIDKLAAEGIRFTDGYAGCTVCAPSRSALMTGLHGGHTPVRSNPGGVPLLENEHTVADLLHAAGYKTGLFGKWGLGDIGTTGVPWKHGFDEFFGTLHQAHAHFQYPRFLYNNDKEYVLKGNDTPGRQTYANDVINEKSLEFIRRWKDQPFFLYCSPTMPHFEPHVPEDSIAEYRGKVPKGAPYEGDKKGRLKRQEELGPAYAGLVARVDGYLGRVMRLLKELKLDGDTLVFFTSDNGGMFQFFENDYFKNTGALRGQKGNFYEGGVRVPLIARWPGKIKHGQVSGFAWSFHDFLPTAAEVAGLAAPKGIDGMSVLPTLLGKKQKPHEYLYWELPRYVAASGTFRDEAPPAGMRRGNWKAVRNKPDGPVELYDLSKDPGEAKDLAGTMPKLAAEMDQAMRAARTKPRQQKEPPHVWWDVKS